MEQNGWSLIYENPLAAEKDVAGFRMEGDAAVTFPLGRMRLESTRDEEEGQLANVVFWCPETFPADIAVEWDFWPIREPGLCILFFAAAGTNGEDLFDPRLAPRSGPYDQYHHGDIHALHVSYFRRKWDEERRLHTCNLRKSYGFHLVAQGADPIPGVADATGPYRIRLVKNGPVVEFSIQDVPVFRWTDDGTTYGPLLHGGKIGFRQMAPMIAEYANFRVYAKQEVSRRMD
ncbi:MAG: hypothetical protein K0Q94_6028 [Paenibacillus sp.]|jgi:hypothetical protein|uniref:YesU family protein n=1 Tax=Paenibacillus sp. GCM10012303 TaxID=3317340 RepID=UPI0029F380A2|nr:hypothetical protein [Paenibacillus sp.]